MSPTDTSSANSPSRKYLDALPLGATSTDQSRQLRTLYDSLATTIEDELGEISNARDVHIDYALDNVSSHLDRAKERNSDGFLAAAVIDLSYARAYLDAVAPLRKAEFDQADMATLEVEQELVADRFNRLAANLNGNIERLFLQLASLEYNTGVESFGTFNVMEDQAGAERALRHYAVADAILDTVDRFQEDYDLV